MWSFEVSKSTTATTEKVWQLWSNVSEWNHWDFDIKSSSIEGALTEGAKGFLIPTKGPKSKFEITECTPLKSFTATSSLPLCKMKIIHYIMEGEKEIKITHKVVMSGPLSFLFSKVIGSNLEKGLPETLKNLVALAEKNT